MSNIFADFRHLLIEFLSPLAGTDRFPAGLDFARVTVEPPRDPAHGDLSTNAALVLARQVAMKPFELAELICGMLDLVKPELKSGDYQGADYKISVAQPGFINFRLSPEVWYSQLRSILHKSVHYGDSNIGNNKRINIEFVSANPTGPMHVGHGRGAIIGDVLATLLQRVGYDVHREYYINDAGAQVDALARSVYFRYCEEVAAQPQSALLHSFLVSQSALVAPEGFYPGEYLKETGRRLFERDGERWIGKAETVWLRPLREFAVVEMMSLIKSDLELLGINFNKFRSELDLHESGAIDACVDVLRGLNLVYVGTLDPPKGKPPPEDWEPRPQLLFRSTAFGDDVDRPLKKSDGSWTYFASDIAYHFDKCNRQFDTLIDIWGVDHGGYVKRVKAAVQALTNKAVDLDIKLYDLVNLLDNGVPVQMSKRAGTFVTLEEVVKEVGKGVFRFIMLTRRNDHTLDFDFSKVREHSKDNMVFYVQYAHARICSVFKHAKEEFEAHPFWEGDALYEPRWISLLDTLVDQEADSETQYQEVSAALMGARLEFLSDEIELSMIRLLANWPRMMLTAADFHEPHRIAFYLNEVAAQFHLLWTRGAEEARLRFIIYGDIDLTRARLALLLGVKTVIASGLAIMGVKPVGEM